MASMQGWRPARPLVLTAGSVAGLLLGCNVLLAAQASRSAPPLFVEGSAAAQPWQRYPGWPATTWDQFSDLRQTTRTPAASRVPLQVAEPVVGNAVKGQELAFSRARGGGCVACHVMGPHTPEAPGSIGPDLSRIGEVGRPDSYLFNYVYDPRHLNPDSVMPPWGAHQLYTREEITDIVAFLKTLKAPAAFANRLDDPALRPKPVENRDATDPFVNPAVDRVALGKALSEKNGPSGKSCVSCHSAMAQQFAGWAAHMPQWEPRMKKMLGVEEFVYRHAKATTGADYLMQTPDNTSLALYLDMLSNGKPIQVNTAGKEAQAVLQQGKLLFTTKIGQLNFSCADCHSADKGANKWIRGQFLGLARGQLDHYPIWRTSRNEVWDVRKRLQWCNLQVRANDLPPDAAEYDALEFFLKSESNGLLLNAPNIRH